MEDQGAERSSSPSGSEDVDSDGESKHDDTENGKESDENEENGKDDDSDSDASDASREEGGMENPGKSGETLKCEDLKNLEDRKDSVKEFASAASESLGGYGMDGECYPLADLPLEVITTVEPTNYAYPVLKNMSNGVLTHRNIFTEFERSVLVNIINKYRNIVDTRSRTREIYLEKQNVWQQIVEEYNGTENIMVRTEKELRKCWDNMKYRAKQAEKEMVKTEEAGVEDGSVQVKVEPPDQDTNTFTSDYEPGEELSWPGGEGVGDEDHEPALKRARQESPKLSSLLLAAANKRLPSKKSGAGKSSLVGSHKSSSGGHYNFPECTKVQHGKKKSQSMTALSMAAMSEIPILPKGLASCLSITNIPNPVSVPGHMGIHPRNSASPSNSPGQASMKPMPSLKKMVPNKHQSSNNKTTNIKSPKKSNGVSKTKGLNSAYHNPLSSGLTVDSIGGNSVVSPTPAEETDKVEHLSEKALNTKLATQRLEQERKEHDLRMKLLEKELQAHTYQSQYWSLKLKLLRSGRENAALGFAGATNGDID